jgi:NADH-quinone oxidoreductase subunit C
MTPQEILEKVKSRFGEAVVDAKLEGVVEPWIKIKPEMWPGVATFLRDDADLDMSFLSCISGMDYGKDLLGAVYHVASLSRKHKITVRVDVPRGAAAIHTVSEVWPTANWLERETYDMFGIRFTGHPDPRRILLPEDWEGYPLRKDYKVPEFYQGMKVPY